MWKGKVKTDLPYAVWFSEHTGLPYAVWFSQRVSSEHDIRIWISRSAKAVVSELAREDVTDRMADYGKVGYGTLVIHTAFGPKQLMLDKEALIHGRDVRHSSRFEHLKYRPHQRFGGYTECFKDSALLDLCECIDDINDPMAVVGDI
jgi:hypothetical protein